MKESSQIETTVANVNRGHGWIPNLICPVCGSEQSKVIMTRFDRNVLQCCDCEIGDMEGFPADLGDAYSHEGYNDTQETNYLHNVDYRKKRFAMERLSIIRHHFTKPVSSTRLLDVGCGTGWFLEVAMQEGFAVSGVERGKEIPGGRSQRGCYGKPGYVRLEKRTAGDP